MDPVRPSRLVHTALALSLIAGCQGYVDSGGAGREGERCVPGASTPGAPIPMRRLTASQIERTVRDVLGAETRLTVTDERLYTYRSNIASSIDVTIARAYLDFAEAAAESSDRSACTDTAACEAWLLDDVGPRLFRRALDEVERERYRQLYLTGEAYVLESGRGGPTEGARWALEAMLQSPTFLYVDEVVGEGGMLDDHAMASRLALAIWGQNPDAELIADAQAGRLSTAEDVRAVAERLLEDPRSEGGMFDFVDQWLRLDRLDDPAARPDIAALGPETLDALRMEAPLLFRALVLEGASVDALLTTTETVPLSELTSIYGDDVVASDDEHTRLDPERRAGLLTLPGVQAALAHAGSTSPTLRGYAVLASFLCLPPDPPPAGVSVTLPEPEPGWTTRQRLEAHFSSPACSSCHRAMDGIGFAYESFDWLGRSRDEEAGRPVDDEGTFLLGGREITVDGPVALANEMAALRMVSVCIARQWTRYSTGVPESGAAECLVRDLGAELREPAGLREMILSELSSDWFRRGRELP